MGAKYRKQLPQLNGDIFLTDGGIETTLIFHEGFDLPLFAAFDLFKSEAGQAAIRRYFSTYAAIAKENEVGFILESATWRASNGWGQKLGYSTEDMRRINQQAVHTLMDIRHEYETEKSKMVISGCIGPRGDGYNPDSFMSIQEAEQYHTDQVMAFREADADMVTAITMTYVEEAVGIVLAAHAHDMPVVISFTVETDGKLPSGDTLQAAIETVDALTHHGPLYYMINCAHPTHFDSVVATDAAWKARIRGVRANASHQSHAELDEATELDDGNPTQLGQEYHALRKSLVNLNVLGGCCGTDHRHISEICKVALSH